MMVNMNDAFRIRTGCVNSWVKHEPSHVNTKVRCTRIHQIALKMFQKWQWNRTVSVSTPSNFWMGRSLSTGSHHWLQFPHFALLKPRLFRKSEPGGPWWKSSAYRSPAYRLWSKKRQLLRCTRDRTGSRGNALVPGSLEPVPKFKQMSNSLSNKHQIVS